jgi:hypothetical protein
MCYAGCVRCGKCQSKLAKCPGCGNTVYVNNVKCLNCGYEVTSAMREKAQQDWLEIQNLRKMEILEKVKQAKEKKRSV